MTPHYFTRGMTGKLRGFQNKRFQEQAAPLEQFLCATSNSVLEPEGCFRNLTARNSLREVLSALIPSVPTSANTDTAQLQAGSVPLDSCRSMQVHWNQDFYKYLLPWDTGRRDMMYSAGETEPFKPSEEILTKLFSKPRKLFPAYLLGLLMLACYFRTFYKHIKRRFILKI